MKHGGGQCKASQALFPLRFRTIVSPRCDAASVSFAGSISAPCRSPKDCSGERLDFLKPSRLPRYPVWPHHLIVFMVDDMAVPDIGSLCRIELVKIPSCIRTVGDLSNIRRRPPHQECSDLAGCNTHGILPTRFSRLWRSRAVCRVGFTVLWKEIAEGRIAAKRAVCIGS